MSLRYTEEEIKNENLFDKIILAFSSLFLGPFRLLKSISTKIVFLPKEEILSMVVYAFIINTVVAVFVGIQLLNDKHINIWSSTVGIVQVTIAYVMIIGVYLLVNLMENLQLDLTKKIVEDDRVSYKDKKSKPKITEMYDDDLDNEVLETKKEDKEPNKDTKEKDDVDEVRRQLESFDLDSITNAEGTLSEDEDLLEFLSGGLEDIIKEESANTYTDFKSQESLEDLENNKDSMKKDLKENKEYIEKHDRDVELKERTISAGIDGINDVDDLDDFFSEL